MQRRGILGAALALVAAPAVITAPGLLMPVRPFQRVANVDRILKLDFQVHWFAGDELQWSMPLRDYLDASKPKPRPYARYVVDCPDGAARGMRWRETRMLIT